MDIALNECEGTFGPKTSSPDKGGIQYKIAGISHCWLSIVIDFVFCWIF